MQRLAELSTRVPWQLSGVAGWLGLAGAATVAETCSRDGPATAAEPENPGAALTRLGPSEVLTLRSRGWLVLDDALDATTLAHARLDVKRLLLSGDFEPSEQHGDVRSDHLCWVSESGGHAPPLGLRTALRGLRGIALQLQNGGPPEEGGPPDGRWTGFGDEPRVVEMGATPPLPCSPTSADLPEATRLYVPHRDGVAVGSGGVAFALVEPGFCMREVTAILYLSEPANWAGEGGGGCEGGMEGGPGREGGRDQPRVVEGGAEASRGGALLLHLGADSADLTGETASSVVEILPVRPHSREDVDRVAMTVWIGGAHSVQGLFRHCRTWWLPSFL
ncbi:hypothetical protein EMIHUDRAFT_96020 [Emiliania huxleyi CCMP1516]|uniref:Uncharacterized protein n=2 Tax=Emiliania huxleyi TaxID=2903 RepID=A0A0D3J418_EMIH1|nr:hypothetical protein EMIHUDRAFT_96020 [Emiliania huxleyi CCMP1516]EOD18253.1 hypothetical protein EMIHUDRAFT_96020 [Emiliania huxleyi CCMP1516]|eukprot:XP_005770682.1 hypothetical protein EMIHUDRAFT_96020 [Emiliania huxleyi CCMP1516]